MTGTVPFILQQYFSRLGVPFFFAVAGMFLIRSIKTKGPIVAFKHYCFRVGRLLLIWLIIYLPALILRREGVSIKEILFKTPAYLWYLTGLLVAAIPFCFIKKRIVLLYVSLGLYVFGTVFGEAYTWATGGLPLYESLFITTRNGLFFGLPMMCIGEATWNRQRVSVMEMVLHGILLVSEITFVCVHSNPGSMYFTLPGFIYCLVIAFRNWKPSFNTAYFSGISTAIYVMQFGIIIIVIKTADFVGFLDEWVYWLTWLLVMVIPTIFYILLRKTRIVKILF